VVFTDATLTAIAEKRPANPGELAMISGVGARKLERYGDDVLAILAGEETRETAESTSAATELTESSSTSTPAIT
jgi:DNA helicase-2/ATP-dependent DNA helicase PcrA